MNQGRIFHQSLQIFGSQNRANQVEYNMEVDRMEHLLHKILATVQNTEKRISNLETDMSAMKADMDTMKADMDTMKAEMGTMKADMATMRADVDTLKADMNTMKAEMGTMKAEMGTMKADMATMKVKIANLEEQVEHLRGRQDEMYLILRGWEEDRPITRSALDKLDIEVARLKNHRHALHIHMGEPESQRQKHLP
jgi:chromosome segregation ATPase